MIWQKKSCSSYICPVDGIVKQQRNNAYVVNNNIALHVKSSITFKSHFVYTSVMYTDSIIKAQFKNVICWSTDRL